MEKVYTLGCIDKKNREYDTLYHYSRESVLRVIDILISKHSFSVDLFELMFSQLTMEERARFVYFLAASLVQTSKIIDLLIGDISDAKGLSRILKTEFSSETPLFTIKSLEHSTNKFYYSNFKGLEVRDPVFDRAGEISGQINCSDMERRILSLLVLSQIHNPLSRIMHSDENINFFYSIIAMILSESVNKIKNTLSESGVLQVSQTLERDFFYPPHFTINDKIYNFLENSEASLPPFKLYRKSESALYSVDSFSISEESKVLHSRILSSDSSCSLLLYGIPGTGKTEYAKSVSHNTGNPVYFLSAYSDSEKDNNKSRIYALKTAIQFLNSVKGILIIDEADALLNSEGLMSSGPEKGWLVDFLDNLTIKTIWISNNISDVHPAVLRRFTSSTAFSPFNKEERVQLWENRIAGTPLSSIIKKETLQILSQNYDVNAGGIANVINSISNLGNIREMEENQVVSMINTMLNQHQVLLGGKKVKNLKSLSSVYDPSILNADKELSEVESAIKKYDKDVYREPLNILLWGQPGTGKTEYVKYLAQKNGKTLLLKRPSDLLSKYVGDTESLIAESFTEAEEKGAILFLDEADSFFINRDKMERNFEKTQTNELLTQMENFSGILICSTNHLNYLDTAVMRRFSWKIELKALKRNDRISLFRKIFNTGESQELSALNDLNDLTPGDMYAVHSRLKFSIEQNSAEMIIKELKKECMYKTGVQKRVIGF